VAAPFSAVCDVGAPFSAVSDVSAASDAVVLQALAVNAAPSVRISSRFIVWLLWAAHRLPMWVSSTSVN
jgi:hypothetical protein